MLLQPGVRVRAEPRAGGHGVGGRVGLRHGWSLLPPPFHLDSSLARPFPLFLRESPTVASFLSSPRWEELAQELVLTQRHADVPADHSPPFELRNHSLRQQAGRARGASAACAHLPRPPWLRAPPGAAVVPLGPCPPSPLSRWVSRSGVCSSGSRLGAWFPTLPARQPSASSPAPSLSLGEVLPLVPLPSPGAVEAQAI